jgi:hypothetical protein
MEATETELLQLAKAVRAACAAAAVEGYERAAADGLCHEGAWEAALEAIRALDVAAVIGERSTAGRAADRP